MLDGLRLKTGFVGHLFFLFFLFQLKEITVDADILRAYVYLELGEQEHLQVRVHHGVENREGERERERENSELC